MFPLYLSRILLSAIFIISGTMKIYDIDGTLKYMQANGMPFTMFFLVCAIILELSGRILLLTGKFEKAGARLLILFLVPTTLIFHIDFAQRMQVIQFLKNSAIISGLVTVLTKEYKS